MPVYSKGELNLETNWLELAAYELAKNQNKENVKSLTERIFRSLFGLDSFTTKYLHYIYLAEHEYLSDPRFLLWMLSFLKHYEKDTKGYLHFTNSNQMYFQNYVWEMIYYLSIEMD